MYIWPISSSYTVKKKLYYLIIWKDKCVQIHDERVTQRSRWKGTARSATHFSSVWNTYIQSRISKEEHTLQCVRVSNVSSREQWNRTFGNCMRAIVRNIRATVSTAYTVAYKARKWQDWCQVKRCKLHVYRRMNCVLVESSKVSKFYVQNIVGSLKSQRGLFS